MKLKFWPRARTALKAYYAGFGVRLEINIFRWRVSIRHSKNQHRDTVFDVGPVRLWFWLETHYIRRNSQGERGEVEK